METLRTFIAIELDDALKAALRHAQEGLSGRIAARTVRWVHVEGIHLTLKFLGDTPVASVEGVKAAFARAAEEVGPFRLAAKGLGCFPNMRQPRVVWVGVEEPLGASVAAAEGSRGPREPLGLSCRAESL